MKLLEYLRSRTEIDIDSLDIQLAEELGPFIGCTSNQADSYLELLNPSRAALLKKAAALGRQLQHDFPGVSCEELAVEISMVSLSLTLAPLITGEIFVMSNPSLTSIPKIVENAKRISDFCQRFNPGFDRSRLCIKVASTWEGLQACRKLSNMGIKTLATTLFTYEQAVLAGEAGCSYVSPFVHELKAIVEEDYQDEGPATEICWKIQKYYRAHSISTRVKAAGAMSVDEVMSLAGIASMTIAPDMLRALACEEHDDATAQAGSSNLEQEADGIQNIESLTFVNDEPGYRSAFGSSDGGRGAIKTEQAIEIFRGYQLQAEALMRDTDMTRIG